MDFDFSRYLEACQQRNERANKIGNGTFLPVLQWSHGEGAYTYNTIDAKSMLKEQLEGIGQSLETDNDHIPYLEPWHGVGVYAQAFGCPFFWHKSDAPWVCPIVHNLEELKRLQKPDIRKCEMLNKVLETTEYFLDQTKGKVYIAATDTQSALGTLSLICDTTWMLTCMDDHADEFHRVLQMINETIIEFSTLQRSLCKKVATPGHTMWSPELLDGISVSDDLMPMIGPVFYRTFSKPYHEKIGQALGGVAIHSCGNYRHLYEEIKNTKYLYLMDMALGRSVDPDPNFVEDIVAALSGTDRLLQVRCDAKEDRSALETLFSSDVHCIVSLPWNDSLEKRKADLDEVKRLYRTHRENI